MKQRGGCCLARYNGGGYNYMSKVDRVMMRFRPIAPKPISPNSIFPKAVQKKLETPTKSTGRGKRRNYNNKNNTVGRMRKTCSSSEESSNLIEVEKMCGKSVKTMSFLPEEPGISPGFEPSNKSFPQWLSFSNAGSTTSYVKVECMIDTWMLEGCGWYGAIGRTDKERVMGLDHDTCPGFVTDGLNRVRWTNSAYRINNGSGEVAVVLERGVVIPVGVAGFTCRVWVVKCGGGSNAKTAVPCDVWRMECGGFAWRLDTDAALSLGR